MKIATIEGGDLTVGMRDGVGVLGFDDGCTMHGLSLWCDADPIEVNVYVLAGALEDHHHFSPRMNWRILEAVIRWAEKRSAEVLT